MLTLKHGFNHVRSGILGKVICLQPPSDCARTRGRFPLLNYYDREWKFLKPMQSSALAYPFMDLCEGRLKGVRVVRCNVAEIAISQRSPENGRIVNEDGKSSGGFCDRYGFCF